jgi:hypothetical protein
MTVRELPGWPPLWIGISGQPAPRGEVGVLRSVEWRVDLKGTPELRLTIESGEQRWLGSYPGGTETRARFDALGGDVTLQWLYRTICRYIGEPMTRLGSLELPPTAGHTRPSSPGASCSA